MLDLLFVALFQAAAGDPAAAPPATDVQAAADPAAASEPATAQPAQPIERRRCRKVRVTGSMISQRVCRTDTYEEERADRAARDLNTIIDRPDFPSGGGFQPATGRN